MIRLLTYLQDALATILHLERVIGFEPTTFDLEGQCSTNWATPAYSFIHYCTSFIIWRKRWDLNPRTASLRPLRFKRSAISQTRPHFHNTRDWWEWWGMIPRTPVYKTGAWHQLSYTLITVTQNLVPDDYPGLELTWIWWEVMVTLHVSTSDLFYDDGFTVRWPGHFPLFGGLRETWTPNFLLWRQTLCQLS